MTHSVGMTRRTALQIGLGTLASAASLTPLSAAATAAKPTRMILATGVDPGFAPFYIAAKTGILRKHGIAANLKLGPSGGAMVPLVISNQANASMAATLPGLVNHLVDPDLVAVAQLTNYDHWYGIVATDRIKTVSDLKGRKIAIAKGTASEALWYATLKHFNLDPADFVKDLVNLEPPEMVAAIARHDIDAFVCWEPWISRTILAVPRTHLLMDNYGILQDVGFCYMNRKWIGKNRAASVMLVKSLIESVEFIREKPAKTKKVLGNLLNLSSQLTESMMAKLTFSAKLDKQSYQVVRVQVDQLKKQGRIKGEFDYSKWFYPDLLKAVSASRVNLPSQM